MDLELQKFDILTTQDLTHQHSDCLLVAGCIVVVILCRFGSYHLDGNLPVNTRIAGKIDLAHTAASK